MRAGRFILVVVLVAGWTVASLADDAPVWPPPGTAAPAEVAWQGHVDELRPKGMGGVFRAVAGASKRSQRWQMPRPVAVTQAGDRIFIVDTALGWVSGAKRDGSSAIRFRLPDDVSPVAVAATPDQDRILVADRSSGAVFAFELKGDPLGEVVPGGVVKRVGGLGVCADGDVLITDAEAGQVVRVGPDGTVVARTGRAGAGDGEFNTPTAVVEGPDGSIWVLDTFNFRVQQLDPGLGFVSQFGQQGDGSGHFALPKGLAVDPQGHIYVSDARFDVVQVFDREGRLLLIVGGHGAGVGQFWNPAGIAIDERGRIAVADTGNHRVQLLSYQPRSGER